jgi:hypothetical protein
MHKIHADPAHYNPYFRGELIDVLKPFWGKPNSFSDEQRQNMYCLSERDVTFANTVAESDLVVLPMSWNYYLIENKLPMAEAILQEAEEKGKKVLSWTSGDFGVRIPHHSHLTVIRTSGYRSRLPDYHRGMPVFFSDPMESFYNRQHIIPREKGEKPVIGFCGQSKGNLFKYAKDRSRTLLRNAQYHLGLSPHDPQDWRPSTLRRARILEAIEKDSRLTANFIKRSLYRAGAQTKEARHLTTLEFYDNMVQSDYVVCVRGGGNFSVRLYETLAMGRIPVFVNTDCLLPLANRIKWRDHLVWVEEKDMGHIGDVILEFHRQLSPDNFRSLQENNRQIRKEFLRIGGYFRKLLNDI